ELVYVWSSMSSASSSILVNGHSLIILPIYSIGRAKFCDKFLWSCLTQLKPNWTITCWANELKTTFSVYANETYFIRDRFSIFAGWDEAFHRVHRLCEECFPCIRPRFTTEYCHRRRGMA